MKTSFTLNTLVASLCTSRNVDQPKLTQACEAYLNGMQVSKETSERSSLRERKAGNTATAETVRVEYTGTRNSVSAFIAYNDAVASLAKRGAKVQAVITLTDFPAEIGGWIAEKFTLAATTPKSNSKAKSNGKAAPAVA